MSSLLALPDWISHIPKVDDSHGIATVAPAHTMQLEGTYEDFEILGDTAVRQTSQTEFETASEAGIQTDLSHSAETQSAVTQGLKYKPPKRTYIRKRANKPQGKTRKTWPATL
ncbi:hypothetical protein ABFA07_006349 [Porites harrisoni]